MLLNNTYEFIPVLCLLLHVDLAEGISDTTREKLDLIKKEALTILLALSFKKPNLDEDHWVSFAQVLAQKQIFDVF